MLQSTLQVLEAGIAFHSMLNFVCVLGWPTS